MSILIEKPVEFETAKLAKEKGFKPERGWNPEYVPGYIEKYVFSETGIADGYELTEFKEEDWSCEGFYLAPAPSLLLKWLRVIHKLYVGIYVHQFGYGYLFSITDLSKHKCIKDAIYLHNTYEQALETGLIETLKLIEVK